MHQNHYQENFFLLTPTNFKVPSAETSNCRLQMEHIMPRLDFFSILLTYSYNGNKAVHFLQNLTQGLTNDFFFLLSFLWSSCPLILTDFIRFKVSFLDHFFFNVEKEDSKDGVNLLHSYLSPKSLMLSKYQLKLINSRTKISILNWDDKNATRNE